MTASIIVIVIFASVAVVMIGDGDEVVTGDLVFTISLDKTVYEKGEVIPVTLTLTNGMNNPVNVTNFHISWNVAIDIFNLTGEEIARTDIPSWASTQLRNNTLQPQDTYEIVVNFTNTRDMWMGNFFVNVTYTNYHRLGDDFDWDNYTKYVSNTLSFIVGWPQNHPALATFQPINEDELKIFCEVADSPSERAEGLMYRTELEQDKGMLFIFDSPRDVSFWMKNTLIPLDIIFVTEHGFVTNVAEAEPELGVADADLTRYQSDGPILYVIEINQGLSAANGIHTGTYVNITYMP